MPVADLLPVWPDERATPWRVVPVTRADVLWDTLCQNHLFEFDQEGGGLLHKAHFALTTPHAEDRLVLLGAWLAMDQAEQPIGVSVVSRWLPKDVVFLQDVWMTWTDVFVLRAHRTRGIGRALASYAQQACPWSLAFYTPPSEKMYRDAGLVDAHLLIELFEKEGSPLLAEDPMTRFREHQKILLWWKERYAKTVDECLRVDKLCASLLAEAHAEARQSVCQA